MDSASPFQSAAPDEVPLSPAPLVRVIAQLRFAPIAALAQLPFVAPFQEALRAQYPSLRPQQSAGFMMGIGGTPAVVQSTTWRFVAPDEAWAVSLAPDFVALETTRYSNRKDFFKRMGDVFNALAKVTEPGLVGYERFGVRYVNRIRSPQLDVLPSLVRPAVLGVVGPLRDHLAFSICESNFVLGDAALRARWGLLPPGATTDPTTIEPIGEASWILDLDMSVERQPEFDPAALVAKGTHFAEASYSLFRWCVTDDFLKAYGGNT